MSKSYLDITGHVFGKLVVLQFSHKDERGRKYWACQCDCGNTTTVQGSSLKSGLTASCGCSKGSSTHSLSGTKMYKVWSAMKNRVLNKNNHDYAAYGGRGISCSEDWLTFENFLRDMGSEYAENLSLERIDVNGNYCKENCKWIPAGEQQYNKTMQCNNTSGITGVYFISKSSKSEFWVASYSDPRDLKSHSKWFSVNKWGFRGAKELAITWRKSAIEMLIKQGIPYVEGHGNRKITTRKGEINEIGN